jgi:hypothetical protein
MYFVHQRQNALGRAVMLSPCILVEVISMFGRLLAAALITAAFVGPAFAGDVYVHGYTRRDGTYVQGYHRTTPDSNPYNNYSTKGNVNPWTGKPGTVDPNSSSNSGYPRSTNPNPYGNFDND